MSLFSGIVGQNQAIQFLQAVLDGGQPRHAYLFTGPPGVGKTRAALEFAGELLNQGDAKGRAMFAHGHHPDFYATRRDKTRIGIDEVRRMEKWLSFRPYLSQRRVVLITEAQLLSLEAANALLKTLEEPPAYAVLLMVSDEKDLLSTIVSRCQEVRFFSLLPAVIEKQLVAENFEANRARIAAYLGRGSLGQARILAGHAEVELVQEEVQSFLAEVSSRGQIAILEKAEELEKNELQRLLFLGALEILLRDVMVYLENGSEELLVFPENAGIAARFSGKNESLRQVLLEITALRKKLNRNINPLLININLLFKVGQAVKEARLCR